MRSSADAPHWAVSEFADAALGDVRRPTRLIELAGGLAQHPTAALPEAWGDDALLKAAYRFFANDASEPHDVLDSHSEATSRRLHHVPGVLAGPDTTAGDWTSHPAPRGLGPLGPRACQGLLVHSTLAFTPARLPLGLLAQQGWARDPADGGTRTRRKPLPISQQESQTWLLSLAAVCGAQDGCPQSRFVSIGDREADVDALLAAARPAGVELLIRAAWDRCVQAPERHGGATVAAHPGVEPLRLQGPRRGLQPGRAATLALRLCPLTLRPPQHRKAEGVPAVALWAVQGQEVEPPAGGAPLEWLLVTTGAVQTVADALARVEWYACRWGSEVWQRILKSGGRIDARQVATAERWQRCLTLYSVIAGRVFYATMLARAVPEMPWSVLLESEEWPALSCGIHHCPTPPDEPPTWGEAVRWIASLGGFGGRRRRDQPGTATLWRGFQHLRDLTKMYCIMRPAPP
jgi:hypothetical protein